MYSSISFKSSPRISVYWAHCGFSGSLVIS